MEQMNLLATLNDKLLGLDGEIEDCPEKNRQASRCIIFNEQNEIALIYTQKHGHHKLPGGGIEEGEDWKESLKREAIEEAGCEVEIGESVGKIIEERNQHRFRQVSYCAFAKLTGLTARKLTDLEISEGYELPVWMPLEKAVATMKKDKPKTYIGHHMHARDLIFLEAALKKVLEPQG